MKEEETRVAKNNFPALAKNRWMLKATPVNPLVYIYWYYNIDPKNLLQYVRKSSKIRKKLADD